MAPPHATDYSSSAPVDSSAPVAPLFKVNSPNVEYTDSHILSKYTYSNTVVNKQADGSMIVEPIEQEYHFKTERTVPRVG